jgi:acyl-CoA synthetase (AMP-forming)/AMP-acid ligase II
VERHVLGRHPGGPPGEQPGGVELGGDVGERESHALPFDDRVPEGFPATGVVAGELERGARYPESLGGHHRPRLLKGAQRGERLKAFVVSEGQVSEDDLKSHAKGNLAKYKVPREIEFVDELPRKPQGKVDKRQLEEGDQEEDQAG